MQSHRIFILGIVLLGLTLYQPTPAKAPSLPIPFLAPDFTHQAKEDWINGPPLRLAGLTGKVVLLNFWTFDCWNCYRSFPWLNALERRLRGDHFQLVGVHSPEFEHEKIRGDLIEKMEHFQIHYPVMIDNDFSYWRAMRNRYWPSFYIIDKKGLVRGSFVGETHADDPQAREIERLVRSLMAAAN